MNRTFTPSQLFAKTNRVFSQKNHEQQVASSEKVPTSSGFGLPKLAVLPFSTTRDSHSFQLQGNILRLSLRLLPQGVPTRIHFPRQLLYSFLSESIEEYSVYPSRRAECLCITCKNICEFKFSNIHPIEFFIALIEDKCYLLTLLSCSRIYSIHFFLSSPLCIVAANLQNKKIN